MALIDDLITDIGGISATVNTNILVSGARASVTEGIKSFMISPKEKATILANFEMQFTGGILNKIIDASIQARVSESQIALSIAEAALKQQELLIKEKEILLQEQRITLAQQEIALKIKQIDVMEREITLKEALNTAQIAQIEQQTLTEVQNTIKVTKEHELLSENKLLVIAQQATEAKRTIDAMAGINIKNWQAESTKQSALFEESRRIVLLKSTQFNNQIQKSKEENATLNSLAVDDSFVITETHLTRVKAALDAISVGDIAYTSEITQDVVHVDYGT